MAQHTWEPGQSLALRHDTFKPGIVAAAVPASAPAEVEPSPDPEPGAGSDSPASLAARVSLPSVVIPPHAVASAAPNEIKQKTVALMEIHPSGRARRTPIKARGPKASSRIPRRASGYAARFTTARSGGDKYAFPRMRLR